MCNQKIENTGNTLKKKSIYLHFHKHEIPFHVCNNHKMLKNAKKSALTIKNENKIKRETEKSIGELTQV